MNYVKSELKDDLSHVGLRVRKDFIELGDAIKDTFSSPRPLLISRLKPQVTPSVVPPDFFESCFRIVIEGEITSFQPYRQIFNEAKKHDRILIDVMSNGGDALAGMEIFNSIRELVEDRRKDVRALVSKKCYSVAVSILVAVPPQKRYGSLTQSPKFMIHGSSTKEGHKERRSPVAREINDELVVRPLVWGSRLSERSLRLAMESGRNYYFDADIAIEYGLISGLI